MLPQRKKHACIPMTHFYGSLSSEKSIIAVQLHGKWIDNKPHWRSKVAEYWAGLNLSGTITHTFTLMMDADHVSKTPLCYKLGSCCAALWYRVSVSKRGNYTPWQVLRSISAVPKCMMGLTGAQAKPCYTWPQRGQIKEFHHGSGLKNVNGSHGGGALHSLHKLLLCWISV